MNSRIICLLLALCAVFAAAVPIAQSNDDARPWPTPSEVASSSLFELRRLIQRFSGRASGDRESAPLGDRPDFCREYECPKYEEEEKSGYSLRTYEKSSWVSTRVKDVEDMRSAQHVAFRRLFKYIQGYNVEEESIEMTVPVIFNATFKDVHGLRTQDNDVEDDQVRFVGSFYLPDKYQKKPEDIPIPRDRLVCTHEVPKFTVAVKSFGGHADEESVHKVGRELKEALSKDKIKFCQGNAILAVYNEPWVVKDRHNEIWIPVEKDSQEDLSSMFQVAAH